MSKPKIRCPQCRTHTEYSTANAWRPFCSERCKMIDLGAWASDAYSIGGRPIEGDDELDGLLPSDAKPSGVPPSSSRH